MGKSNKLKLFTYIQSGSLLKLKHYLEVQTKKNKEFDINVKSGDQGRTALHIACLLGDDAIVRCLLHFGAHGGARDNNDDTPLHLAAKYVVDNFEDYKLMMEPLIKKFPDVVDSLNRWNESPTLLLKEAKERHKMLKKLVNKPEETGSLFVDQEEEEEPRNSNWEEKLTKAWENDLVDLGVAREQQFEDKQWEVPDYPTFDEWADRIAREYKRKHLSDTEILKRRKETNKKRKYEEIRDMTDRLEKEEEKYRKKMIEKKRATLETKQREYKTKMDKHIADKSSDKKLRFKNIPWPCHGSVVEMVEVIMVAQPEQASDRRKFILKQQILWHPDKFRQRCFNLLHDEDKDVILETVNLLSQSLNNLLKECYDN